MIILPPIWYEDEQRMDLSPYPNAVLILDNHSNKYLPVAALYDNFRIGNSFDSSYLIHSGDSNRYDEPRCVLLNYISIQENNITYHYHNKYLLNRINHPFARSASGKPFQYIATACQTHEVYCIGEC